LKNSLHAKFLQLLNIPSFRIILGFLAAIKPCGGSFEPSQGFIFYTGDLLFAFSSKYLLAASPQGFLHQLILRYPLLSLSLEMLDKNPSALVLPFLVVFPLTLYVLVCFEFWVGFDFLDAQSVENAVHFVHKDRIYSLALVF